MKKQFIKICGGIALLASFSMSAGVQAQTVGDVLKEAAAFRAAAEALTAQRAGEFNAMSDTDKQAAIRNANAQRATIQAQVDAKTQVYSANDLQINQLNTQLREKANQLGLGEIFGLARGIAGDSATTMQQSMINAQFADEQPNRVTFLRDLAASERVLTSAQLERLWIEMQRELSASGQVTKYTGTVDEPNGTPRSAEVVRVGPFIASTGEDFLSYIPELGRMSVLAKQPEEYAGAPSALAGASSGGYVSAVVDSTRGIMLNQVTERQTWGERIEKGEEVGVIIMVVGAVGTIAFIFQLLYLLVARMGVSSQLKNLQKPSKGNALGRVLLAFNAGSGNVEDNTELAELRISEAVMREVPKLERFQPLLRLVVAAGPLLGLVGTVIGMIFTFQSITESGSSDPKLMANGIGQAMIATLLGLGIAVPMLFANALLSSLSRSIVQILDEQSTGILADQIEKRKHG
jgi:biopolymer transport protein ExbB